jgi:hypothetical protein
MEGKLFVNHARLRGGLISLLAVTAGIAVVNALPASGHGLPVEPPLAASNNVETVAHIPGSAAGMNFKGHYAFVSGWDGITVLDIAKAAAPEPVGTLPLPHFENEDVDLCGDTLIVVNDREARDIGSVMYVIDIKQPKSPSVRAVLPLGLTGEGRGSGHIANFVKEDCSQAWLDGGDHVEVVDLSKPSKPKSLGKFESAASHSRAFRVSHDTERDKTGAVWNVGGGGAAGYRLTDNPLKPRLLGTTHRAGRNESPYNDFILHNSQRRGQTLLVTEEDYVDTNEVPPGGCRGQGHFETWDLARLGAGKVLPRDTWETELNGMAAGGAEDSRAPVTANCSSHWFDAKHGVAAVGWYEQGVRFLDYTNPGNIKQVGYYLPANGSTWAAYWSPTDRNNEIVYTADAYRGVDVLRIDGGGQDASKVEAPVLDEWFGDPAAGAAAFQDHPTFGFVCPVLKPGVDAP